MDRRNTKDFRQRVLAEYPMSHMSRLYRAMQHDLNVCTFGLWLHLRATARK